jgi:hypothetical protein
MTNVLENGKVHNLGIIFFTPSETSKNIFSFKGNCTWRMSVEDMGCNNASVDFEGQQYLLSLGSFMIVKTDVKMVPKTTQNKFS